jgi:hypothetical protein
MLASLQQLKTFVRVYPATDTSQDGLLQLILKGTDQTVKTFCKRNFELCVYTEFRDGQGIQDQWLRNRPVRYYNITGTLTQGLPQITGLPSTTGLVVGMPAVQQNLNAIPAGAVIQSVDSGTQVTLTQSPTISGSYAIFFGIAVWLDAGGFNGQGINPFASNTQLSMGLDYTLPLDDPTLPTASKSGLISRLGGGYTGSGIDWPFEWRKGTLTARMPPAWPIGKGNIKLVYAAGWSENEIPNDLQLCVLKLCAWVRAITPVGVPVQIEAIKDQIMSLLNGQTAADPEVGTMRETLRHYRERAW